MNQSTRVVIIYSVMFAMSDGRKEDIWRLMPSHNDKLPGINPFYFRAGGTVGECAIQCTESDNCESFFFNSDSKECHLHSCEFDTGDTTVLTPGARYFALKNSRNLCGPETRGYFEAARCTEHSSRSNFIKFYLQPKSWEDSRDACVSDGGHLATIICSDMQDWIQDFIVNRPDFVNSGDFWIDGNDKDGEGNWVDNFKNPLLWINWNTNQPSNGGSEEDCCSLSRRYNYKWNDQRCWNENAYVCQIVQ